jgi:alanine-glyoxylate transaminase/serine-glyoxylate transaminase/serine-pyruvate transaminase
LVLVLQARNRLNRGNPGVPMPGQSFLFIPGPTNTPERVRQALNIPYEDQRAPDVPAFTVPLLRDLRRVFKTETGEVFVFTASGTGGWEAALTNTLSPGDRVLAARFGRFSELWVEMCQRLGLEVDAIDVEWGEGVPVEAFARKLEADKERRIKAVLVCHNETTTGVTSDIAAVRKALDTAGHPAMLYADGVSSIASIDFRMDEWGVDLAVSGSQKGFMLPTGLAIVGFSRKAMAAAETARLGRYYFDLRDMAKWARDGWYPYTPAFTMLRGLRAAVDQLFDEGLDNVFARHHRLAEGVRRAVAAWGLGLCAKRPDLWSDTVSAIRVPDGIDANAMIRHAYQTYRLSLGVGLGPLAGKVFRIGHLGDLNELMVLAALGGTELTLRQAGVRLELGSGVAAAQGHFLATAKARAAAA